MCQESQSSVHPSGISQTQIRAHSSYIKRMFHREERSKGVRCVETVDSVSEIRCHTARGRAICNNQLVPEHSYRKR